MAEFKLGRLRFVWQGAWVTPHLYVKDDIIRYGGKSYVCLIGHTSNASFYTDLNAGTPLWALMTDGVSWKGTWSISTLYAIGDIVKQGANSYVCVVGNTSNATANSGFYADLTSGYWINITAGIKWNSTWNISSFYNIGDVIKFGAKDYICSIAHTSSATANSGFYSDLSSARWQLFVDGTEWVGAWATTTFYKIGDIISYGANSYLCSAGHTSSGTLAGGFYSDLTASNWVAMNAGQAWQGTWGISTYYKLNDVVKFGAKDYICVLGHTSSSSVNSGFYTDLAANNWQLFVDGVEWSGTWTTATYYKIGDISVYGGTTYICTLGHTSQSLLESDQSKWAVLVNGINFTGVWSGSSVVYKVNDIVKYGADLWICNTPHTSSATFNLTNFTIFVQGLEFVNTWSSVSSYVIGDVATYGGYSFTSLTTNNTNNTPSTSPSFWSPVTTGFTMLGAWSGATAYKVGSVINYGGYTYVSILDNTNVNPSAAPATWSLLNTGLFNAGTWAAAHVYRPGDIALYVSSSYVCILLHTAATGNSPVNDVAGTYWNLLAQGSANSFNTTTGDISYRAAGGSDTRLPIGTTGQFLEVGGSGIPAWTTMSSLQLGGAGTIITGLSTDGTFATNSDSKLPTEKAIGTYINSLVGTSGNLTVLSVITPTVTSGTGVDLTLQAAAGRTVQMPGAVNHGNGSLETYALGASVTWAAGSLDTYALGSTLVLNGTATQNVTPVAPTDVPNKKYVDRTLTLNNLWTSAW